MRAPILRLCEDILSNGAALSLPPLPRMVFVVHGDVTIGERGLRDGEALHGEGSIVLLAGRAGACVWLGARIWLRRRRNLARGRAIDGETGSRARGVARRRASSARRQRRVSPRRLRSFASAPRAGDSLPDRRRNSNRHRRPLDILRARCCVVRERTGCGLRAVRPRSAQPIYSCDDSAAGVVGEILIPVRQRGGQDQAPCPAIRDASGCAHRAA